MCPPAPLGTRAGHARGGRSPTGGPLCRVGRIPNGLCARTSHCGGQMRGDAFLGLVSRERLMGFVSQARPGRNQGSHSSRCACDCTSLEGGCCAPPPHLRGHWTVSGDISDPHNWGDPPSIRHVGAWGAALHPQCPGWLGCQQCLGNGGGQQLPGVLSHEPHHGVSPWPQSPTAGKQREWFSR